jgi:hypothetical protein
MNAQRFIGVYAEVPFKHLSRAIAEQKPINLNFPRRPAAQNAFHRQLNDTSHRFEAVTRTGT